MRRAAVLCAVFIAGIAQAGPSINLNTSSTLTLAITQQADIPIQMAVGIEGNGGSTSTSVSVNNTGLKSTLSNPGKYEVAYVNTTTSDQWRMRFVLDSVTNLSDCIECYVWVKNQSSGSERLHIQIEQGVIDQATGPWENMNADGQPGDDFRLKPEYDVDTGKEVILNIWLEYVPPGASFPSVKYWNMTLVLRK